MNMPLTATDCCARIAFMGDEEKTILWKSSQDEWVRLDPDQQAYQKLHLCRYLAELPELPTSEPSGKESDGGESPDG